MTAGCGGEKRPEGLPKLTPCELTVQYEDGTPIEKATVMMYPFEGKWYANGTTDVSGNVTMATMGKYPGAAPGEFRVTVTKQDITYPPGYDPEKEDSPEAIVKDLIDRTYARPGDSPLKVTVAGTPVKETLQVKKPK